ncbi:hypothetical protein FSP39_001154 [Pinctada imbricata]|uniref:Uncharacterized protein n=1 Tax=Pinctada imbricata TaxID=66713 RepID=A0AA89BRZ4_PINIB|nr:hypothetical protein FSP39_001154 [Pinctada imbricata]
MSSKSNSPYENIRDKILRNSTNATKIKDGKKLWTTPTKEDTVDKAFLLAKLGLVHGRQRCICSVHLFICFNDFSVLSEQFPDDFEGFPGNLKTRDYPHLGSNSQPSDVKSYALMSEPKRRPIGPV